MNHSAAPGAVSRHAYLIMAYNNFDVVKVLLQMVDDSRNDVFIHIDRSVKGFDPQALRQMCKESKVEFVPSVKVHWGHYSQIQSVLNLLEQATKSQHSYYHLLSGSDLPIKSQDHIHDFCQKHQGKEFVGFGEGDFLSRVRWLHFFNTYRRPANRRQAVARYFFRLASTVSLGLQRRFGLDRSRRFTVEVKKGSDWFSITHDLALYLLGKQREIHRLLRFSEIPTEFYVQTMIWNSGFRNHVFDMSDEFASSVRLVDWRRGDPYVFRKSDLPEILGSDRLFARKFLAQVDIEIVHALRDKVMESSH